MILRPEELGFLRYLKQANVPLNEFEFSWNKVANIQVITHLHNLRKSPPPPLKVLLLMLFKVALYLRREEYTYH